MFLPYLPYFTQIHYFRIYSLHSTQHFLLFLKLFYYLLLALLILQIHYLVLHKFINLLFSYSLHSTLRFLLFLKLFYHLLYLILPYTFFRSFPCAMRHINSSRFYCKFFSEHVLILDDPFSLYPIYLYPLYKLFPFYITTMHRALKYIHPI